MSTLQYVPTPEEEARARAIGRIMAEEHHAPLSWGFIETTINDVANFYVRVITVLGFLFMAGILIFILLFPVFALNNGEPGWAFRYFLLDIFIVVCLVAWKSRRSRKHRTSKEVGRR